MYNPDEMRILTGRLKTLAMENGATLAGVAAVESIPSSVPPLPPSKVMASARTVFVFAVPMLRGSIESPSLHTAMNSTNAIYREEDILSHRLGLLIEDSGYRAALVSAASPIEMSNETKGLLGDISLRHAAVAAGLGHIGTNRLLLTPKYGPRVRLGAVVTDAPLTPDSPLKYNPCDDCGLCVKACPAGALHTHTFKDAVKCLGKQQAWGMAANLRFMEKLLAAPPEQQKQMLRDPEYWNLYQAQSITLLYTCYACLNSCPVGR